MGASIRAPCVVVDIVNVLLFYGSPIVARADDAHAGIAVSAHWGSIVVVTCTCPASVIVAVSKYAWSCCGDDFVIG